MIICVDRIGGFLRHAAIDVMFFLCFFLNKFLGDMFMFCFVGIKIIPLACQFGKCSVNADSALGCVSIVDGFGRPTSASVLYLYTISSAPYCRHQPCSCVSHP